MVVILKGSGKLDFENKHNKGIILSWLSLLRRASWLITNVIVLLLFNFIVYSCVLLWNLVLNYLHIMENAGFNSNESRVPFLFKHYILKKTLILNMIKIALYLGSRVFDKAGDICIILYICFFFLRNTGLCENMCRGGIFQFSCIIDVTPETYVCFSTKQWNKIFLAEKWRGNYVGCERRSFTATLSQPLSWYEVSKPLLCEPWENKRMNVLHFCVISQMAL